MLYGFSADDVVRIRKMLIAFEQGRLLVDSPPPVMPSQAGRQDTFLGHITASIPANSTGTAVLVDVDTTTTPPTLTDFTRTDRTYTVLNQSSSALAAGYYLLAREPSSGCYVPANASEILSFSGASTSVNGAVIPANTGVDLSLSNGPSYDTDGYIASPKTTFIAPEDGYYQAVFTIFWSSVPPHTTLTLSINSTAYNQVWTPDITTSPYMQGVFSGHLVAGQAVKAHVFATNACNVNTGVATITKLSGVVSGSDTPPAGVATINQQTGNVTLAGNGDAGGVGVNVSTVGSQITAGLSEAALAAARLFLARNNF